MSDISTPLSYQALQDMKYENPDYWDMMDLSHGPDPLVKVLMEALPQGSVFEYGTGRGRNAIPLAEKGYKIEAQDIADKPLSDLRMVAKARNLDIRAIQSDAKEHVLSQSYDALICFRVLHFMETADAWQVIGNMQAHTNANGLNALVLFTDRTPHGSTPHVRAPFFPSVEEILSRYTDWNVLFEKITESQPSVTSNGKSMVRLEILLQKQG